LKMKNLESLQDNGGLLAFLALLRSSDPPPNTCTKKRGINLLYLCEYPLFEIESVNASLSATWHNSAWAT
jgi:hypothetical protein